MKFIIKRSNDQQFYFVIYSSNGQVLATSETYVSKAGCHNAINSIKAVAPTAPVVDQA